MIEKEQALLAKVLDMFADRFDKHAVLRGGMVLRILGSSRLTNDLDYVFVPYKSRKDIVDDIIDCLKSIQGAELSYSLNSKCLRVVLSLDGTKVQIEAKVAMNVKTSTISTGQFSPQFNLPKRIIHIVDYSTALANKMAAWNERRLIRDIYDIWFFLQMNIKPDEAILAGRLKKPAYSRLINPDDYFSGNRCAEFYEFVRKKVSLLSDKDVEKELADYLEPEEIAGLLMHFRAALVKLA